MAWVVQILFEVRVAETAASAAEAFVQNPVSINRGVCLAMSRPCLEHARYIFSSQTSSAVEGARLIKPGKLTRSESSR